MEKIWEKVCKKTVDKIHCQKQKYIIQQLSVL